VGFGIIGAADTGAADTGAKVGELTGAVDDTIHGAEDVSGLQIIPGQHGFPWPTQLYVMAIHESGSNGSPHGIQNVLPSLSQALWLS